MPSPSSTESGAEINSNFYQLLLLRSEDDPSINEILKRTKHKYTDHSIHDEFLKLMSMDHLRKISDDIVNAGYFTIECNEVTDSSNIKQVIVCLKWVDSTFEPHEDFIGLCSVDNITAESICEVLKDAVLRMKLDIAMCRAQCYDGAANMKKAAETIKSIEKRVLYLHSYGHT